MYIVIHQQITESKNKNRYSPKPIGKFKCIEMLTLYKRRQKRKNRTKITENNEKITL